MDLPPITFTGALDVFVPIYSVLVGALIIYFHIVHNKSSNEPVNYTLKNDKTTKKKKKNDSGDWKTEFNGDWIQTRCPDLESKWLPFLGYNFVLRKLASSMMYTLHHKIEISDGVMKFSKDFGGQKEWSATFKIGTSKENAEAIEAKPDNDNVLAKVWADEEKKLLYMDLEPVSKTSGIHVLHTRRLTEDGEIEMEWDAYDIAKKKRGGQITYFSPMD